MQVYKAFLKIITKNLSEITIYVVVFLFLANFLGNQATNPEDMDFEETKINIAFINNDEESTLVKGLRDYIKESANIVDINKDKEVLQDALFFREVEYILTIPKGFTDNALKNSDELNIEKSIAPNSVSSVYMDNIVNKYLSTLNLYTSTIDNIDEEELVKYIKNDLSKNTEIEVSTASNGYIINGNTRNYYNYLAYSTFAILILGISSVISTFNNKDLKMRNLSSAVTIRSMNFQMVLGNITFAIVVWIIMIGASFIFYGSHMFSANGLLFILNSFVFTMSALSISLLVGTLVKSRNAMSGAANVISLGACFISGVFVPQSYLGDTVVSIAKFNPTYWYVKANNEIALLVNHSKENLEPIFMSMLIVFGFSVTILAVTLVIMKQKSLKNN